MKFDAIIVGTGPAGVSAAFPLVDAGLQVLMIDAGMSAVFGSRQAALILEGDKAYALHRGVRLEIPTGGGAELLNQGLRRPVRNDAHDRHAQGQLFLNQDAQKIAQSKTASEGEKAGGVAQVLPAVRD